MAKIVTYESYCAFAVVSALIFACAAVGRVMDLPAAMPESLDKADKIDVNDSIVSLVLQCKSKPVLAITPVILMFSRAVQFVNAFKVGDE